MIPRRPRPTTNPRLTRRGLITSGVLAGVLAATGVPVLAQSRGGTLRLALPVPFTGWRPGPQDLAARLAGSGAVFDTLTEIAASGEVRGELAQSWDARDAGTTWTFTLRPARFHDGTPVTADDAVASLLRHTDPHSPCAWLLARMTDVTATSPDTVMLRLATPDADLPLLLADPHLVIAPGGRVEEGIGTGLYRFDTDATLIRVGQHWKDGQAGWFDRVTLLNAPTDDDRLALLVSGEADAAPFATLPSGLPPHLHATTISATPSLALAPPFPPNDDLTNARAAPDRAAAFALLESTRQAPAPHVIVHTARLLHTDALGGLAPLDSTRIAERWWFA
jgi:ABC-type transport system substrate-binding protein